VQQQTADILGISLRTLGRKLKAYNEGETVATPDSGI
jgi:DNA-binding NtrC family response regulator